MTIAPTIVADCLVNLFGAIGAVVLAHEALRDDPNGPMARRISLALTFVGALFSLRCVAWWFQDAFTSHLIDQSAALTPLVSLFVAEGLMRRHAPLWMKRALLAAPVVLAITKILPFVPEATVGAVMILSVVGGYAAIAVMLWTRDQGSLTAAENAGIRRVLQAMLVLAPLIVTDFRSIWPDVPVRLGALGALLLLYLGFGSGNLQARASVRIATVPGFAAIAALLALGYQATGAGGDVAHLIRAGAVGLAGLLCAAIFSEARGVRSERNRPLTPMLKARTPAEFEVSLKTHSLLGGAHVLSGADLEHVQHPAFQSLLEETGVLTVAAAPWGRLATDDGVERALSLMTAHEATDLVLLTRSPLRLLVIALPAVARDARSESDIHLARLAGELAFVRTAQS